ncbi:sugar ABC transporter substrate-binding protein [Cellulosilyticum sp. I15G10I2]|uniref:sugar ABC transporter substrate-binding protein n=1 Tax=Cellulosilyticum sp. I15G10I2 TaxID=1892843 RepID=UPI00085BB8EA|nr:substrate-binding domain-containing protein [Cellulosilyticum sp. I15G10I2]
MIKRSSVLTLLCICLLGSVGCSKEPYAKTQFQEIKDTKIKIGLSVDSFIIERWQREKDIFISRAGELGAEVNVQDANGDIKEQIAQVEYLIDKKMDVITIIPIDADALADVVRKAKRAGIKIIAYDRIMTHVNVDLYISFDNKKVGELMAKSLIKSTPEKGNILMLCGPLIDNNVLQVTEGFKEVLYKSNLNVIDKVHVEQWVPERAFALTNEKLRSSYTIDGIMCGNDGLAGQAIKALAERRMAGTVSVVGQDADVEACQRIVEGTQNMTVYKPVDKLAKKAVEYAVRLAQGETLEISETFFDGTFEVPYEKLEPIAVTKENIDEVIIDGGFHPKEDVYLNILNSN